MKVETLSPETALCAIAASDSDGTPRFQWAMIQTYSRLFLGNNPLNSGEDGPGAGSPEENGPESWRTRFQDTDTLAPSLLEARFFSEKEELRIFRNPDSEDGNPDENSEDGSPDENSEDGSPDENSADGNPVKNALLCVLIAEEPEDRYLEETCEIANSRRFGSSVTVRRVIAFDEDGQAYVDMTRLSGWKGA